VRRREPELRSDRKLPIMAANFGLFGAYVCTLAVLASGPDSELRIALPLGLAVFGLACFAPLVVSFSRRSQVRNPAQQRLRSGDPPSQT